MRTNLVLALGQLILINLKRKIVWTQSIQDTNISYQIPTSDWSKGTYFLRMIGGEKVISKKILIH